MISVYIKTKTIAKFVMRFHTNKVGCLKDNKTTKRSSLYKLRHFYN